MTMVHSTMMTGGIDMGKILRLPVRVPVRTEQDNTIYRINDIVRQMYELEAELEELRQKRREGGDL